MWGRTHSPGRRLVVVHYVLRQKANNEVKIGTTYPSPRWGGISPSGNPGSGYASLTGRV